MFTRVFCATAIAACVLTAQPAAGQEAAELGGQVHATRSELEASLRQLDEAAQSTSARDAQRSQVGARRTAIRSRLETGDFHPGDRVAISVKGDVQPPTGTATRVRPLERQLSDTFTVGSRQELTLPVVGAVTLRGVLRSELDSHLTQEIARFVRDPVVDAWPLIRISVQGAVTRPGYYTLPIDAALSDALMAAGGPARGAKIARLRIERDGKSVWAGSPLQRAIAEGRTLGEMSLLAGDQFTIPETKPTTERVLRTVGLALAIPVAIFTLSR
jgi:protein involved in polysaccharide export with SLBB domain